MNELAIIKDDQIFTDSIIIADGTNNEHESIVRLIDNYTPKLEELGKIEFIDLKSGKRGRPTRIYELNEPQATFLMTLLRNSDQVVQFKLRLTKEFFRLRQSLIEQKSKPVPKIDTNMTNNNQFLYTIDEVADILKVNKNQVYKLINSNVLKNIKLGRKKVPRWCIDEFLRDNVGLDVTDPFNIVKIDYGE